MTVSHHLKSFELILVFLATVVIVSANPVVPNGKLGAYTHGKYPSWGNRTHAGVDILAAKSSKIYAFADGEVIDVQGGQIENCKENKGLGNLVVIKHFPMPNGKVFYTIYLHMESTPLVKIGDKVSGGKTQIGNVGRTGAANCAYHTHFEIRYFASRLLNDKNWNNIYGSGDQRESKVFKDNWENPAEFFERYPSGMSEPQIAKNPIPAPIPNSSISEIPTLFLFDISGSMNDKGKIDQARQSSLIALREIQENKKSGRGDTPVSVWTFSGDCMPGSARQILAFTQNLTEAENILSAKIPHPDGGTPLPQAIEKATEQLNGYFNAHLNLNEGRIVLLSDGQSTCGEIRPAGVYSQAQTITVKKIRFLTIGFDVAPGSAAERDLQYLASVSGGQYFSARNEQLLARAFEKTIRIYLPKTAVNPSPELENVANAILRRDFQRARQFAVEYLKNNPADPFGYYNLAVALEALNRYKSAAENYRKYLQLAPTASDRQEVGARIVKLEQDYRDQFVYYQKLMQSDLDYLKAYYQKLFNRENEKNAAEFTGFVAEKQGFYQDLPDILEIRSIRVESGAKDLADSLGVLRKRVSLQSFDRDAVSLLTISIGQLEDVLERLGKLQSMP